jgi:glyoxylase-like metal-dependent hydrolase (beta-lactamase superfamily II)
MSGRPPKQEQERASSEVTEVAPGVLRAQLPIDLPGLGHVNCYLLEDAQGVALVDPGLPGAASFNTLRARLNQAGFPLRRVHSVIVTHSHHDHFGGAGRIRHLTGARLVTHRRFRLAWDPAEPPDVDVDDMADMRRRLDRRYPWDPTPWGGDGVPLPFRRRAALRAARRFPRLMRTPVPTDRLDDADTITLAGREWVAVHTPGHTDDHLCLFDPAEGVMLSGDHVLPTITPHIGGLAIDVDPLGTFFGSLDKVAGFGADTSVVLPAHGHPFTNLEGRVESIKQHHLQRLDRLRKAAVEFGRAANVGEYAAQLFAPHVLGAMADSETYAHLEHLRRAGELRRDTSNPTYEYALP